MNSGKAEGKTVVITGASSGAGWAMATEFAKEGAQLVLAARRTEALEEVANECRESGANVWTVQVDTRGAAAMRALASAAIEYTGSIDVWINNAGVLAAGALEEIPAEVNEAVIATNLIGYVHGAHAALPWFKAQGNGWLINNLSIGAWLPTPYMAAYTASKFGLEGFTEALRGELRPYPYIHLCNLYPGFLDTPGMQHAANYTGKQLTPSPPLTDPGELAKAVVRLIKHPKHTTTVGIFPHFVRLAYRATPLVTRNITTTLVANFLEHAPDGQNTPGNVIETVPYGTGPNGGWKNITLKPATGKSRLVVGLAIALLMANSFIRKM
jgi:short-subunit dehydrogenase